MLARLTLSHPANLYCETNRRSRARSHHNSSRDTDGRRSRETDVAYTRQPGSPEMWHGFRCVWDQSGRVHISHHNTKSLVHG